MLLRLLVLAGLFCCSTAAIATSAERAAGQYRRAQAVVAGHYVGNGTQLDGSRAAAAALAAQWAAARNLVAALLDRDPPLSSRALAARAKQAGLDIDPLRLDANSLLVDAESGEFGTVFLLTRAHDGTYRNALALDSPARPADGYFPELAAWLPSHAGNLCRDPLPQPQWSRCGPLSVERLIPLPSETGGARRFAILAYHVTPAGGTVRYQVSIWRWDGRTATPLLARTLFQVLGNPAFAGQDARGFTLHADEKYQALIACGTCQGRRMTWRFDLPPAGAAPPRIRSVSPELDLVDPFYTRLFAHRPVAHLAAPAVIARLKHVELDMLSSWRYLGQTRGTRLLCVDAMGFDRPQIFRIVTRGGKPWIADVAFAAPHACDSRTSG